MDSYYYILSVNGLLFLLSLVFYFFPPKKINYIYGYRTKKSMQNKDIWNFANSFFSKQFLKYSFISLVLVFILAFISNKLTWQPMVIMIFSLIISILKTEQELNKNFDNKGKRINKK